MPRLLIECTYVFEHPKDNSGIQRVVRNVIRHIPDIRTTDELVPVVILDGVLHKVNRLAPTQDEAIFSRLEDLVHGVKRRFWRIHHNTHHHPLVFKNRVLKKFAYTSWRIIDNTLSAGLVCVKKMHDLRMGSARAEPLETHPGDVLVLLDSSWHGSVFSTVEQLKSRGVKIVSVIYDLIPLTHPQFCDEGLVKVFEDWFQWIPRTADGFICISATIQEQLQHYIETRVSVEIARQCWFRHFHLGSDLDLAKSSAEPDKDVRAVFHDEIPVYLAVSTIEPRKNHAYLLDAFDILWKKGSDVKLCIIGKIGWKCDDLIARIRQHPEFGKRLFMFNKASDTDLEFAYSKSRSLVFASYVEGFGLPIVEALQRKIQAMVSDIPVFREVGGESVRYFDLHSPASLANLIEDNDSSVPSSRDIQPKTDNDWTWLTWKDSAQQFIDKVSDGLTHASEKRNVEA